MKTVRKPAVAGMFYPGDPDVLRESVDAMLAAAQDSSAQDSEKRDPYAKVVLAPHAGYVYSGEIAGHAYSALDPDTKRVLIIGPTHRVGIAGMALTGADLQRTPLGDIPSDQLLTDLLEDHPDMIVAPFVHAQEHSIEVHLPFLQRYLNGPFTVVPVAVGMADPTSVAEVIRTALELPDTAVVVSSDMSHFMPQNEANAKDQATVNQIVAGETLVTPDQACGAYSVNGMITYANAAGLKAQVLSTGDSGETSGDCSSVVGYASLAWYPVVEGTDPSSAEIADESATGEVTQPAAPATPGSPETPAVGGAQDQALGDLLTWIAHTSIARTLGAGELPPPSFEAAGKLDDLGACFVTLEIGGRLRGCIGSLSPRRPLGEDVAHNALAAAFEDPRFPKLSPAEFAETDVEVSVLGAPQPLDPTGTYLAEAEVLDALVPGVDGVILRWRGHSATFLPQVWESLPDPQEFLAHLKAKAGLPPDFWAEDMEILTYPVTAYERPARR